MSSLARDNNGRVVPHDDPTSIPDDELLVRNIHEFQDNPGADPRPSSGSFSPTNKGKDPYEGMSVDMLSRLKACGVDQKTRWGPNHVGSVVIRAGDLRQLGLKIGPDPSDYDGKDPDHYHANVWGVKPRHKKKIRASAQWYIKPEA